MTLPDSVVEAACPILWELYLVGTPEPHGTWANLCEKWPVTAASWRRFVRAALEAAAPMLAPQWIPCGERMPEDNTEVMVHCAFADEYGSWTGAGFHVPTGWKSQDSMIMDDIPIAFPVTHWMNLPQPPKEDA
jgi:hypothetical protein